MAILEAIWIYASAFQDKLIVESNSCNAISCMNLDEGGPWKFKFYVNKLKALSSSIR